MCIFARSKKAAKKTMEQIKADTHRNTNAKINSKSIGILIPLLLWVLLKKCLRLLLKITVKSCIKLFKSFIAFYKWWSNSDTRKKRQNLTLLTAKVLRKVGQWILAGLGLIWYGIIIGFKAFIHSITHIKPLITKTNRSCKYGFIKWRRTNFRTLLTTFVNEEEATTDTTEEKQEEMLLAEMRQNKKVSWADHWIEKIDRYIDQ